MFVDVAVDLEVEVLGTAVLGPAVIARVGVTVGVIVGVGVEVGAGVGVDNHLIITENVTEKKVVKEVEKRI